MEMFSRLGLGRRCPPGWDGDIPQAGAGTEAFLQPGAGMEKLSRTEAFPSVELR